MYKRLVRDDRRQADAGPDVRLALEGAIGRIDVDQRTFGAGDDQAATRENGPLIPDRPALRLLISEGGKLGNPAHLAVRPRRRRAACASSVTTIDPFAGDPRRGDAGDVEFPLPLAADQLERDHPAALAHREHLAAVDNGLRIDVGDGCDAGADAGSRKLVLPDEAAVLVAIGIELTRRETGDDRALTDGRRCRTEHAGDFQRRSLRPIGRAVARLERVDLVVLR